MASRPDNQRALPDLSDASATPSQISEHAGSEVAWLAALVDSTNDAIIGEDIDGTPFRGARAAWTDGNRSA